MIPCPAGCGRDTADGLLCGDDTRRLTKDLRRLPELMRELRVTYTRQSQAGTGNGGRGAQTAVPFDQRASKAADKLVSTAAGIIQLVSQGYNDYWFHEGDVKVVVGANMSAWSTWLLQRVNRIRGHAEAGDIRKSLEDAVKTATWVIDRPADRLFIGQCDLCQTDLYARDEKQLVVCKACEAVALPDGYVPSYLASTRRDWMRSEMAERFVSMPELLDLVPKVFGVRLNPKTVRSWAWRGVLKRQAVWRGEPLYRVGDAIDLAGQSRPRRGKISA